MSRRAITARDGADRRVAHPVRRRQVAQGLVPGALGEVWLERGIEAGTFLWWDGGGWRCIGDTVERGGGGVQMIPACTRAGNPRRFRPVESGCLAELVIEKVERNCRC